MVEPNHNCFSLLCKVFSAKGATRIILLTGYRGAAFRAPALRKSRKSASGLLDTTFSKLASRAVASRLDELAKLTY